MIIKHITRRWRGASRGAVGFGRVVRYILREGVRGKGEGEGVRGYGIVGCVAETERLQRLEMAAVIEQNTESVRGASPQTAHRTVRDSLPSYGSSYATYGRIMTAPPVCEQPGLLVFNPC
jgi:hypothetical protein